MLYFSWGCWTSSGDANLDHFPEMVFFFLLLVHKQFVGGILKLCKHPVSHQRLFETALLIHIFKVHHLMSFDICLQLWKHPHNHASKPICHLPTFPLFLSCHPSFSSFPTLFLSAGNHWRLFCHHRIIYIFWNFVRWIIRSLSSLLPSPVPCGLDSVTMITLKFLHGVFVSSPPLCWYVPHPSMQNSQFLCLGWV